MSASVEKSEKEREAGSIIDEKGSHSETTSFDVKDGDEALHLVGIQRSAEFTEEYNRKLRRKLVC